MMFQPAVAARLRPWPIGDTGSQPGNRGCEQRDVRERLRGAEEVRLGDVGDVRDTVGQTAVGRRVQDTRQDYWDIGDVGGVDQCQPRAAVILDEHLDRVMAGAAVDARCGVGVRLTADDEGRADTTWLGDRPGRQRRAVAPVDRGREVGERAPPGWRRVERGDRGPLKTGAANTGKG